MCEEPVRDNVLCLYEGEVQPNEAPLSPPTASPHCHPGTVMLTVIGDCVLRSFSPLNPSHPLPPCSTFIWPHLLPLAFNAELGSPLIKVKASQCLAEKEKKVRDREEGETEREKVGEGLKESDERMKGIFTHARLIYCRIQMSCSIVLHVWLRHETSVCIIVTSLCRHHNSYGQLLYIFRVLQWFTSAPPYIWETHRRRILKNGWKWCRDVSTNAGM